MIHWTKWAKKNLVCKIEGEWWKMNSTRLPILPKLDKRLLSAPSSSVESERLFSIGGNIYTPKKEIGLQQNMEKCSYFYTLTWERSISNTSFENLKWELVNIQLVNSLKIFSIFFWFFSLLILNFSIEFKIILLLLQLVRNYSALCFEKLKINK